jgi:hypothetical protein
MSKSTATAKTNNLETLRAKEQELREKTKLVKQAQALREWEQKTKKRNSQYVVGSLRAPKKDEAAELGHCHGQVCSIKCEVCGVVRTINKQDAFQVRFCKEHKNAARKAKAKARRLEKALDGKSAADIEKEISVLDKQLKVAS